jgi:NAD dependent epimerase/dehydratase family enzyme
MDTNIEGPFNVTAPEPVTMDVFARALGEAMARPSLCRVPSFVVKMLMGSRAEAVLYGQRAVPKQLVESGFAFVFPDVGSALADIVAKA